jgi:soluble lytic murein transglycosylase
MAMRLTGNHRRPSVSTILAAAIITVAISSSDGVVAASKAASQAILASAVPMPRPSPLRLRGPSVVQANRDAIGDLIADAGANEASAAEDNDAPQVSESVAPPAAPSSAPRNTGPINVDGLKLALAFLDKNDAASASLTAYSLPNRIDIKIVEWLITSGSYSGVTAETMAKLAAKLRDWPSQSLMRLRYEQALAREKPAPSVVIAALGGSTPQSDEATLLLARAYLAAGRRDDAANLIRAFWRNSDFSESIEKAIVADFSGLLRTSDHKWRMDRLIYEEREAEAIRASRHLSKDQQALAKAVIAVVKQKAKAAKGLDGVTAALRKDHLHVYARIQLLRRAGKITEAGNLLVSASRDPAIIVSPDAWWVERRLVSRLLVEAGNPRLAYAIAASHSVETPALRAEAEFHAGWYALEYLHDPATAAKHFTAIASFSTTSLSLSRAEYWLGRSAIAAGRRELATAHFQRAAAHPTSFYGQLAAARLGSPRLGIDQPPRATAAVMQRFNGRELVEAVRHLSAAGYQERAAVIYRFLAETLDDPAEIALLAAMAEKEGKHPVALQVGRLAAARGLPVDTLAFPTAAIPSSTKTPTVERPVVFAIARQESAFNPGAVSSAGARGLLQLLPATAKETAKEAGLPYSKGRLTSDPAYNATLGATYLGGLIDSFGGSYVMSFAAYNAGASRVTEWVERYGDPRDPDVDVVNWIEMIPFTETRNYVQRIIENLQVYRARLGSPALLIESDLRRGASG